MHNITINIGTTLALVILMCGAGLFLMVGMVVGAIKDAMLEKQIVDKGDLFKKNDVTPGV